MIEEERRKYHRCPYLGQKTDPETALSYPSGLNVCFHPKQPEQVDLLHQEEFCLSSKYVNCKEYLKNPSAKLPSIHNLKESSWRRKESGIKEWMLIVILVILALVAVSLYLIKGKGFPSTVVQPTNVSEVTFTLDEKTPTETIATATLEPTEIPTNTTIPTPILSLEIPLGLDQGFMIHQVQEGDSLGMIQSEYGTTLSALQAINYQLYIPLLPGSIIIIPINKIDVQGFPSFEAYQVKEEISLNDLANRLSVDLNEMKYYNALPDSYFPEIGDWLLIPRVPLPTP